ncbi:MAG: hypothetical protein PHI48_07590 [Bacteroidales bacterium]|nr:hypothetical protein [Bacteroidales bacterium]MDD4822407.1 hypothetical protein [Bacteroidales bacterium]
METHVYKEIQKKHQEALFGTPFFEGAKGGGIHRNMQQSSYLEAGKEAINLYKPIRNKLMDYFSQEKISWWSQGGVTGNLLSSRVACLNHLFAVRDDKDLVRDIANALYGSPDFFMDVKKVNCDSARNAEYIAFAVTTNNDYLHECKSEAPKRGGSNTTIDALIIAVDFDNKKYLLPIRWEYTEEYGRKTDKTKEGLSRYTNVHEGGDNLIGNSMILKPMPRNKYKGSIYFLEPFYQLMKQTLWAEQLLNHKDQEVLKADACCHIHVVPKENVQLRSKGVRQTGYMDGERPAGCKPGLSMEETWRNCLKSNEVQYKVVDPEVIADVLAKYVSVNSKAAELGSYLKYRYYGKVWKEAPRDTDPFHL